MAISNADLSDLKGNLLPLLTLRTVLTAAFIAASPSAVRLNALAGAIDTYIADMLSRMTSF